MYVYVPPFMGLSPYSGMAPLLKCNFIDAFLKRSMKLHGVPVFYVFGTSVIEVGGGIKYQ